MSSGTLPLGHAHSSGSRAEWISHMLTHGLHCMCACVLVVGWWVAVCVRVDKGV